MDAVDIAGGMDRAAQYNPDARILARQCVSNWLTILDRGGEERKRLEERLAILQSMRGSKAVPAIEWIATSNLLMDTEQKQEVERRRKLAESNQ